MESRNHPYPLVVKGNNVPLAKKIETRLFRPASFGVDEAEYFKRPVPIYLGHCKKHHVYYLDLLRGHRGYLVCPRCLEERREEDKRKALEEP